MQGVKIVIRIWYILVKITLFLWLISETLADGLRRINNMLVDFDGLSGLFFVWRLPWKLLQKH